jgi:hypothetical protein
MKCLRFEGKINLMFVFSFSKDSFNLAFLSLSIDPETASKLPGLERDHPTETHHQDQE